jgi:hypothetical protein
VLTPESTTQRSHLLAITETYHQHTTSDGYAITSDTPHLIRTEAWPPSRGCNSKEARGIA